MSQLFNAAALDGEIALVTGASRGIGASIAAALAAAGARVIGTDWRPIPGLYTCGEMVGGLFHDNYPGGTGLVSGAVFGRIAGRSAAGEP